MTTYTTKGFNLFTLVKNTYTMNYLKCFILLINWLLLQIITISQSEHPARPCLAKSGRHLKGSLMFDVNCCGTETTFLLYIKIVSLFIDGKWYKDSISSMRDVEDLVITQTTMIPWGWFCTPPSYLTDLGKLEECYSVISYRIGLPYLGMMKWMNAFGTIFGTIQSRRR